LRLEGPGTSQRAIPGRESNQASCTPLPLRCLGPGGHHRTGEPGARREADREVATTLADLIGGLLVSEIDDQGHEHDGETA
jgi:hypothetical protein